MLFSLAVVNGNVNVVDAGVQNSVEDALRLAWGERPADGEDVAKRIAKLLPDGWLDRGRLSRRYAAHAAVVCVETNIRWAAAVGAQAAGMAAG